MAEILTESFCERCGTRYTFETVQSKGRTMGALGTLGRGLRHFVAMPDASFDEAMAVARSEAEQQVTTAQLDAFHRTFNFCLSCRQYTCSDCGNAVEGRCLTCAPLPQAELARAEAPTSSGLAPLVVEAPIPASGSLGHDVVESMLLAPDAGEPKGVVLVEPQPEPEPEPAGFEPEAPPAAVAEPEPGPIAPESGRPALEAEPEPEPQGVPVEQEPEPEAVSIEPELELAVAVEPELESEPAPEVGVEQELEREPEPVPVAEPEPVALEPEPALELEPVALEPEPRRQPEAELEPEPVALEQEPERVAVEAEPEPVPEPELPNPAPSAPRVALPEFLPGRSLDDEIAAYEQRMATLAVAPAEALPPVVVAAIRPSTEVRTGSAAAVVPGAVGRLPVAPVHAASAAPGTCRSCGLSLSASARFCRRCGTAQVA